MQLTPKCVKKPVLREIEIAFKDFMFIYLFLYDNLEATGCGVFVMRERSNHRSGQECCCCGFY